jgi:hypothetical protein
MLFRRTERRNRLSAAKLAAEAGSMKYTTLRQAIVEAEKQHGLHELDFMMRELLHAITHAHVNNEPLRVSHLMRNPEHGTFPTISAKLKKLVEGGWIERRDDEQDRRSVRLEATPKTLAAFDMISSALDSY